MRKLAVLLVDDDETDRFLLTRALRYLPDVRCYAVESGIECLDMLNKQQPFIPDFIFLDLNMPGLSGKETLVELKKDPRFKRVPVVIYTGSFRQQDIEETKALGASYYLAKPVGFEQLRDTLGAIFTEHQRGEPYRHIHENVIEL